MKPDMKKEFRSLFATEDEAQQALESLFALDDLSPQQAALRAAFRAGTADADTEQAFFAWATMRIENDWESDAEGWDLGGEDADQLP
jgi:hypothetical protein